MLRHREGLDKAGRFGRSKGEDGKKGRNWVNEGGFDRKGGSYSPPWAWFADVTGKVLHLMRYGLAQNPRWLGRSKSGYKRTVSKLDS